MQADVGRVFLSGVQALARLPIEQLRVDARAGHRTAAFVSGYPGSPLGGFDSAIRGATRLADDVEVVCQPAVNEEYAATAVMGSQLASLQPDAKHDGVLGIWYGKAPGVDRAADALRHGAYAGTSRLGGAVALVGDDPTAKSSTLPSSSAGVLSDMHLPLLYPGDAREALDLGRHAIALSRTTGLWTALKIVADVADGTAAIDVDVDRIQPVIPTIDGVVYEHRPTGRILTPGTLDIEKEIYDVRYPLAIQYAALNNLNHVTVTASDAWLGIVASGATYLEVREAFVRLGLVDDADIAGCGIRLLKMQMPIPFDPATVRTFARGLREVLVVEEKQPQLELLIRDALYALADRPVVVGKRDHEDRSMLPTSGGLSADIIAPVLRSRLAPVVANRLAPPPPKVRARLPLAIQRQPFYCSGCPHNRSTEAPDGSLVGAGIGCHTMAMFMDEDRVGDIAGVTAMGNEGTQWIGMSPFIDRDHLIQNLGDGTYFHSGQLAITAAVSAGVNITYKLLYNGAVAMTGGQDPQGQLPVETVARTLLDKGVSRVLITSEDVTRIRRQALPAGVVVWDRTRLVEAQEILATEPGVTVLIHDQACAAELRRARKRGHAETPDKRVVINERVCEGCGDCGDVSACLSVQPVDTEFGRKTRIDQHSCNLDFSCLEGDCPSFLTVEQRPDRWWRRGTPAAAPAAMDELSIDQELPDPVFVVPTASCDVRMTGIGGTGVVTVSQVLGTAAMLAGFEVRGLDQIGLSQKAGPVVSDLRLARTTPTSNRLGAGQADLLLVFDQLVAASDKGLDTASPDRSVVVGSRSTTPTGAMITEPTLALPTTDALEDRIAAATRDDEQHWADATAITTTLFGDAVTANLFVVGMAVQAGGLAIPAARIEEAIELNGVAIERNRAAFRMGRLQIHDREQVAALCRERTREVIRLAGPPPALATRTSSLTDAPDDLATLDRLTADLVARMDVADGGTFVDVLERVARAERQVEPDSTRLTMAVATGLHKLMAYKDEYEVARLLLDDAAMADARELAGPDGRITYNLHPPFLRSMGMKKKLKLGPWSRPLLVLLVAMRRLRGTWADPFGMAKLRRLEQSLPGEYVTVIDALLSCLTRTNLDTAVIVASLPDMVRGYEDIKLERIGTYREALEQGLEAMYVLQPV